MIDLHVHSTASDGTYSPAQIMRLAREKNISTIALTDHDTIDGLKEGEKAAKKYGINFIKGVELNIEWPTGEFHLLGLGLKSISKEFTDVINTLKTDRKKRNAQIIELMNADGIDVSLADIERLAGGGVIGRPHFAQFLLEKKIVKHKQEAFDLYLSHGKPYYVKHSGANLDEAVVAITSSGGVPVVAHPMSLYLSWGKLEDALLDFLSRGVIGLEAYHPGARLVECERLENLAHKLGFFVTAGSDFHGENARPDRKLGITSGKQKIADRFYTEELFPHIKV